MKDMGQDFKPPRKRRIKAWKELEHRAIQGWTTHTCGCGQSKKGHLIK
jgi:hypothetical protein